MRDTPDEVNYRLESRVRENRTHGSEGGDGIMGRSRPLSASSRNLKPPALADGEFTWAQCWDGFSLELGLHFGTHLRLNAVMLGVIEKLPGSYLTASIFRQMFPSLDVTCSWRFSYKNIYVFHRRFDCLVDYAGNLAG